MLKIFRKLNGYNRIYQDERCSRHYFTPSRLCSLHFEDGVVFDRDHCYHGARVSALNACTSSSYATTCSLDCAIEQLTSTSEVGIADMGGVVLVTAHVFLLGQSSNDNEKVLSRSFFALQLQDRYHWLLTRVPAPSSRGLVKDVSLSSASAVPFLRLNDMGKRHDSYNPRLNTPTPCQQQCK